MTLQLAVSTWSVHRELGLTFAHSPQDPSGRMKPTFGPGRLTLLELPATLAKRGFARAEICHFHLASLDPVYLTTIRNAFASAGIVIQTLLIDDGDLTHAVNRERDMAWIASWIEAAAVVGAENARIIAGKGKPTPDNLATSISGLRTLGRLAMARGVRIVTENWFDLTAGPREVGHILDATGPNVGFLADTGNWSGATKYADLQSIYARAELSHTKAHFAPGHVLDRDDYRKCLQAAQAASYAGPHTLIFEGDGDEWRGVEMEREFVAAFYAADGS
jgi:sugar phosphate isomerase/epimerase